MDNEVTLHLSGDNGHVADIRRMTGAADEEWIKMSFAVYWTLLSECPDSVVRFIRENGQVAHMGLTPEADKILRGQD